MCCSLLAVIRRVGGLEVEVIDQRRERGVIRRVGGLEVVHQQFSAGTSVIRRVGGLEGKGHSVVAD